MTLTQKKHRQAVLPCLPPGSLRITNGLRGSAILRNHTRRPAWHHCHNEKRLPVTGVTCFASPTTSSCSPKKSIILAGPYRGAATPTRFPTRPYSRRGISGQSRVFTPNASTNCVARLRRRMSRFPVNLQFELSIELTQVSKDDFPHFRF